MHRTLGILLVLAVGWLRPAAADEPIDFSRDIRPILADKCFFCHGPDEKKREADLRLDTREGALAALQARPGETSELLRRIRSTDPDERMPPPKSNRSLSPEQIDLIARWVAGGAPWGDHWAFRPLVAPAVPAARLAGVPVRNPIDAFVQARLARQGLSPAPEASREVLIRRLSLDLTGLAPAPAEVAAFVADKDPEAYEKLVDRLLASPAFGERMAWDWLDAARYADSNGYQGDGERTMWPWRDWVVEAFNRNLPYDQFTVWQLAGDLLPGATDEQRLATGFCRNHPINGEGGRISEENRVDYVIDMAETTATVWLGLTTNCCRCHDHKFDPLTRRDYYGLFAFFNQTPVDGGGGNPQTPPVLEVVTGDQREQLARVGADIARINEQLTRRGAELASGQAAWEAGQLAGSATSSWQALKPTSATALHQTLTIRGDQSILAGGANPPQDTYTVTATTDAPRIAAIRLEALRDPSMTQNGLARSDSGNFVLTELEVSAAQPGDGQPKRLKFATALASFEQNGFKITGAFDGSPATGWAVHEGRFLDREHEGVFRLAEAYEAGPGTVLTFTLRHDSPHVSHNLGRFRLSVTADADAQLGGARQPLLAALAMAADKRSPDEARLVSDAYYQSDEAYRKLSGEREQFQKQQSNLRKSDQSDGHARPAAAAQNVPARARTV